MAEINIPVLLRHFSFTDSSFENFNFPENMRNLKDSFLKLVYFVPPFCYK